MALQPGGSVGLFLQGHFLKHSDSLTLAPALRISVARLNLAAVDAAALLDPSR